MNNPYHAPRAEADSSLERIDLSERSVLTRRSFLFAGGVLAATAFSLNAQENSLEQPGHLTAEQREEILNNIETIVVPHESTAEREAQIEKLIPLIARYRMALANAPDVTLSEVARAVEINRLKINMPHYSETIDLTRAESFLSGSSIWLYDDLCVRLEHIKRRFPGEEHAVATQFDIIRNDLLWAQAHGLNEVDRAVGTVIAERFITPEIKGLQGLDSALSYSPERPLFHLTVLTRRFDAIADTIDGEIKAVADNSAKNPRHSVARIFDVATRVKSWIPFLLRSELIPKSEHIVWQERIAERIEKPIFSNLVPLYLAAQAEPVESRQKQATRFWGVPIMLVGPPARPLIQRITSFLENLNGCRVELGNEFANSYNAARHASSQYPEKILGLVPVLAHLSPEPSKKKVIVDDLRTIFKSDLGRGTAPETMSAMLEILLFSDHTFAASAKNRTFSGASSVQACLTVLDENGSIDSLGGSATDTQKFALELVQLCASSNGQERVLFAKNESKDYKDALSIAAENVVGTLVANIYTLSRKVSFTNDGPPVTTVHLPPHWGGHDLIHVEHARAEELLKSLNDLTTFADGIVKRLAAFDLEIQSEPRLLERLVFITQLLDYRDGVRGETFGHHANPYTEITERFPYLSPSAEKGPFSDAFKKARNILYQQKYGTLPSPDKLEIVSGKKQNGRIDNELDTLALSYARAAEKKFICSFILHLWNPDGSKDHRPLVGHRILSNSRMTKAVSQILQDYGMFEKYRDIQDALTQDNERTIETIQKIRLEALAEQRQALAKISGTSTAP